MIFSKIYIINNYLFFNIKILNRDNPKEFFAKVPVAV